MKTYTPIHPDQALNLEWWLARGYIIDENLWYNFARADPSCYVGFRIQVNGKPTLIYTVAEAEIQLQHVAAYEALRRIRHAGNNTAEWSIWAQKTAAWGMDKKWPEQPKDAPLEEYQHVGFMELHTFPSGARFVKPRAHQCEGDAVAVYKRKE